MSGPKISIYSLTGRAREIAFGELRCQRDTLACSAKTRELLRCLTGAAETLEKQLALLELQCGERGDHRTELQILRDRYDAIRKSALQIQKEASENKPRAASKLELTEEAFEKYQKEAALWKSIKARAEKLMADYQVSVADKAAAYSVDQKQIKKNIMSALSGSFDFTPEPDNEPLSPEEKKAELMQKLSDWNSDKTLPEALHKELAAAIVSLDRINDSAYLSTFDSVTVSSLAGKVAKWQKELQAAGPLTERYAQYEALCALADEEPKPIEQFRTSDSLLVSEIGRLEGVMIRAKEQEYISACVDEVMADMGYDLIGSREVRKKSGKRFRNELYTFNEGTAVNVTFSSDGQIAMELGGISHEDRIPTDAETEVLTEDMQSFCAEFADFERRLKAKGVVVGSRIALSPPTAEHAAIINVDDYEIKNQDRVTEMTTKERRKIVRAKKSMHKEI